MARQVQPPYEPGGASKFPALIPKYLCLPHVGTTYPLPIVFWPFALISLVFDTASLNIGFLIYLIYYLSSPSIVLLPIVFWPFALISLVFDTVSLNIGFLIYLIYHLLSPSIILLPIVFWPFACCLYLIQ